MGVIISIAIQKGGDGKSTTCINLSSFLAMSGYKTLCIDFEPQGNTSSVLVSKPYELTLKDVMLNNISISDAIVPSSITYLDVIPSKPTLSEVEAHLLAAAAGDYALKDVIEDGELGKKYDFICIDTPPSLGPLTLNALVASDFLIVPVQCATFSVDGFLQLKSTISRVQRRQNESLKVLGVYINKYISNRNVFKGIEMDIAKHFHEELFKTRVRYSVKIEEAFSHKKPIFFYDIKSPVAQDFLALCEEILERLKTKVLIHAPVEVS